MRARTITTFSLAAAGLLFLGAGCISFSSGGSGSAAFDGGAFKSVNRGDNWTQKTAVPTTTGAKANISGVSVVTVVQDPGDPLAIYLGTADNGLFYSYDGGESWRQPGEVNRNRIPAVAIDPHDKCTLYVAANNILLKSEDCARTWATKYNDARPEKQTTAVAVDFYDPANVWIANNAGDVLKSGDGGVSWSNIKNFGNTHVLKLAMSATDSRKLYVATKNAGLWRTDDGGATWKDLSKGYEKYSGAKELADLALGVSDPGVVVIATKYGLLRSTDGGDNWTDIPLLTGPGTTQIYSLAIDPKESQNIYYGTSTTFYRTTNGGINWVTKKLPTSRAATTMVVDYANPAILYMGVTKFK